MAPELRSQLRPLIGETVLYRGAPYRLLELLEEDEQLVLQQIEGRPPIQGNQFGEARRRVFETLTIDIFEDGAISADFLCIALPGRA